MFDSHEETNFIREEKSAIASYLHNYDLKPSDIKTYKKLVKALFALIKLKTKIEAIHSEMEYLSSYAELFNMVGIDNKKLKEQWSKKNTDYLKQCKIYEQKKKLYNQL